MIAKDERLRLVSDSERADVLPRTTREVHRSKVCTAQGSRITGIMGPPSSPGCLSVTSTWTRVREIVREFEAQAASLRLPDGDSRQLRADMAAVKVQTGLPNAGSLHHRRAPSIGAYDPRTRHRPSSGRRTP